MKKWIISALTLWVSLAHAQDIPIGQWRSHLSYNNVRMLVASEDKIFCATENGLFSYDLKDQSLNKITKSSGLSDAGIEALHYSTSGEALAIGYASGVVDIITEDGVHAVRELKNLTDTIPKQIFNLTSFGNQILAATNYGIIVISLSEMGITDNYQSIGPDATDIPIGEVLSSGDSLYAITTSGIQYGAFSDNLLDFNNWKYVSGINSYSHRNLALLGDKVYVIQNDTSIAQIIDETSQIVWSSSEHITTIKDLNGILHALMEDQLLSISNGEASSVSTFDLISKPNDILFKDQIWIADSELGLSDLTETSLMPNGPIDDDITKIRIIENNLYAVYGPKAAEFDGSFDGRGFDFFENGNWSNQIVPDFDNITDVISFQNELIFSSAGKGLYFQTQDMILNSSNSVIQESNSEPYPIISSLASRLSLWASSYDNSIPLLEYTSDMDWKQYTSGEVGTSTPTNLHISNLDVLWIESTNGGLVAAYPEEDRYKDVGTNEGLLSSQINDLSIDINDELWVATGAGVTYFPDASYVFDEFFESGSPLIFENAEYYFEKNVNAIATDGGGRIWVSDENGLTIFNNLLTSIEQFFSEENSPLLSNNIIQMDYNSKNGEMFIRTDKGLVSYRSSSSEGNRTHQNVSIFPNPVRPDFDGLAGISGLVSDADIKITDINGNLIASVQANGGTASWNLKDYNNRKVHTGIYLIFSADADGSETHIGKIAVVR